MVRGRRSIEADDPAPAVVTGPVRRRLILAVSLVLLGVILALLVGVWTARRPIAEHFIERELERRGVRATYTLDRVGLHNQVIRDLTIGDPARPDLTARFAQVQMRFGWDGSVSVYRIVARGVRLRGELLPSGRVTWGDIDRLLPPPSGKPFRLPDIAVDLDDARLSLKTPYGPLGFAVAGAGNLTGGFKGRLAASSPRLDVGSCSLDAMRANVAVDVEARRPHIVGPLVAQRFACPKSNILMQAPRLAVDSRFNEGFGRFDGQGRLTVASFVAGTNGLANMTARLGFSGTAKDAMGNFDLAAQRARLATIYADRTRLTGKYRLWAGRGELAVTADYDARSSALAAPMVASLTAPLDAARGTPLGPIGGAIRSAVRRMASGFDARGKLVLVNLRGGGAVRVTSADARGPGGAQVLVGGGDGITYYWPFGRFRVDGRIATGGGGLPRADILLRQPAGGGGMSGEARIEPYAAGGSRLALAPVRFAAQRDGSTAVSTIALLDGPFSGGRVAGLRVPITGRIGGPGGGFAFGRGCIDAGFRSLSAGSLRLGPARIPLCPTGGAILAKGGSGPLRVGAQTSNLRLAGRLGRSPFLLNAANSRFSGTDRFDARGLAVRMGNPAAPILIEAASLDGRLAGGAVGTFAGGEAIIGKVPVGLNEAAGRFTFRGGALAIDGSATAFDRNPAPRFNPLRSDNLTFRLAGDDIRAGGTLRHPASGTAVTEVAISHRLSSGNGEATLDVPGIRFATGGLQPEMLTRLTEGVIALVNGTVSGQGRIAWRGDGSVTSTGEFATQGMDLAASFGPVTGLSTTIRFTDLLGLETAPGQTMSVASINPGILVENGSVRYQLLPGQLVKIERGEWPFMGGRLILQETVLNFARNSPKRLTFEVVGLDANTFVTSLGFKELAASGTFDGVLPMIFDEDGGRIVGGRLDSRPGGGSLAYNGVVNKANLGTMGNIAFNALRDLRFNSMIIRLDGDLDGEFATRLTIDGVALGQTGTQRIIRSLLRKIPLKMNVSIVGPFRSLIALAKSAKDPRTVIRDVLPVPLDQIPGVVTEVRNREERQEQTQTPVEETVATQPSPTR